MLCFEIADKKLTVYPCGYDDFNALKKQAAAKAQAAASAEDANRRAPAQTASYRSKAERAEDAKRKQLAKQTEKDISDTEAEIAALQEEIARPEVAADYKLLGEKCALLDALNERLERLYAEYEKLI